MPGRLHDFVVAQVVNGDAEIVKELEADAPRDNLRKGPIDGSHLGGRAQFLGGSGQGVVIDVDERPRLGCTSLYINR